MKGTGKIEQLDVFTKQLSNLGASKEKHVKKKYNIIHASFIAIESATAIKGSNATAIKSNDALKKNFKRCQIILIVSKE